MTIAFDTLKAYEKLVGAGMPTQQAKTLVDLLVEIMADKINQQLPSLIAPKLSPEAGVVDVVIVSTDAVVLNKPAAVFKCRELQRGITSWPNTGKVPAEVFEEGMMEHPAILGLVLSMQERIYSAALEYTNDDGEILIETLKEKQFRAMWKKPVAPTKSSTEGNFQKMNNELFAKMPTLPTR